MPRNFPEDSVYFAICDMSIQRQLNLRKSFPQQFGAQLRKDSKANLKQDSSVSSCGQIRKGLIVTELHVPCAGKCFGCFEKAILSRRIKCRMNLLSPFVLPANFSL